MTIRLLAVDIDGVLTDGTFLMDEDGKEWKRLCYRDLDAVAAAQRAGITIAFLTGESGPLVARIAQRFGVTNVVSGAKDKAAGLRGLAQSLGVALEDICYVGDSDRDAAALELAGIALCPQDATEKAKAAATALEVRGGNGVVHAVLGHLRSRRLVA